MVELLEQRHLLSVSASTLAGPAFTPGNTWTYQVTTAQGDAATFTRTVIGPTTYQGHAVTEVDSTLGSLTGKSYIGFDANGDLVDFGEDSRTTSTTQTDVYTPYQLSLPAEMTAGVVYTNQYVDEYTIDEGQGAIQSDTSNNQQQLTLNSETTESVTVPYGTFQAYTVHDAEKSDQLDGQGNVISSDSFSLDTWIVEGIGPVKNVDSAGTTYVLTSFQANVEHLDFTQQPTATDQGKPIGPIQISVKKSTGEVDTAASGSITVSLNAINGDGKLSGTLTVQLVNGVATFDDLKIDAGGTYTLTAVDDATPPVASATSKPFDIAAAGLIWTGKGDGVNWSDPKNWDQNVKPQNGDSLIFPLGSPLNSNNDLTGLSISSIDIQGSGYTLTGNGISLTGSLTSEAGSNTYNINTQLVGSPEIDDQTGDLDIQSVLSGEGLTIGGTGQITFEQQAAYTGPTTLKAGVTIKDDVLTDALGTGAITIGAGATPVTINAGASGGVATLNNDIIFQDGSTLATDPQIILGGTVTVNGQDSLSPTGPDDQITLNADNIEGSGTLLIKGGGKVLIQGKLVASVQVVVLSGELDFDGTLLGAAGGTSQIVMKGGTVKALSLAGDGGIDLISGTFIAGAASSASSYGGTITLEQSPAGQPGPVLQMGTGAGVGTGLIVVMGPAGLTTSVPLIDASTATAGLTIDNTLVMRNGSIVNVAGAVTFSQAVSVDANAACEINTINTTDTLTFNSGAATTLTGTAGLGLDGPGTIKVSGTVGLGLSLSYGAGLTGTTGLLILSANLGGPLGQIAGGFDQLTIMGGKVRLVGVSGTGGIGVQSGVLQAGLAPDYQGSVTLEQSDSNKPAATIVLGNATGIGTGLLVIATPSGSGNTPVIDATSATNIVSLDNPLILKDGAAVNITGKVAFTQAAEATGSTALVNTLAGADRLVFAAGITDTLTNSPHVSLDGPGTMTIGGALSLGVTIDFGAKAAGSTGELDLSADLGGPLESLTITNGQVAILGGKGKLAGLTGTGGIDVKGRRAPRRHGRQLPGRHHAVPDGLRSAGRRARAGGQHGHWNRSTDHRQPDGYRRQRAVDRCVHRHFAGHAG